MDLLASPRGRRALFTFLYFLEGAPIGFVWWALPAMLRARGVPVEEVAALSALLVLPWALKFLWAPAIDALRGPRWTLRGWIAAAQAAMALALVPLLWLDPLADFGLLTACLFAHAIAAATQDAAIDALAVASTGERERGRLNGWMQTGMLAGRSLLAGGALWLAGSAALAGAAAALVALLVLGLFAGFTWRDGTSATLEAGRERERRVGESLLAALRRPATWLALGFAAFAGAGFEAAGGLAGPLLVDRGLGTERIALLFAGPVVVAMAAGALAGGWIADRVPRPRAVLAAGLVLGAAVLGVAAAAGAGELALLAALVVLYLAVGLFTATSYALFMDLSDPRIGSTQFSAFMGMTNLCEAWSVRIAGGLVPAVGYGRAFAVLQGIAFLALLLLWPLGRARRGQGKERAGVAPRGGAG